MGSQMVVGGLFNAVAFAGAGFLFSKLNHSGYSEEMHRHNLAMEKLSKAREEFYEEEVKKKDKLAELRRKMEVASHDLSVTNQYLDQFKKMKKDYDSAKEPKLSDYYKPGAEMQHYENVVKGAMMMASGAIVYFWVL